MKVQFDISIITDYRGYTARRKLAKGRAPPPPQHPPPAPPSQQEVMQRFSVQERAAQLQSFADQVLYLIFLVLFWQVHLFLIVF